ncbi:uncharacterized protein LOC125226308 [Leguminivora glycinivorella]|uniref:uncharacterized protein LOC125226308 n=1 Tax=Leguminivora glycinivorella TaxID=1035111 RepID=UPI00200FFCFD|nr:uncharacterized protein LOC125226308 [Leguminivora glycinivorella]
MLSTVLALACLSLARCSAEPHAVRVHAHNPHTSLELNGVLVKIEEKLRIMELVSAAQVKQARKLEVIQDKLDRVETTISLRLERAQLAAERLEHRMHLLQSSVITAVQDSADKIERSEQKILEIARNLTNNVTSHAHLLEKASGAYTETWRRGLMLESLMRDGLSLINVTRRELAEGLRALARRQREARLSSTDIENAFSKKLNENTNKIEMKMQEMVATQKRFVDSCQRVQRDDPAHVTDVLDKLIDSLIAKTNATFQELQEIKINMRSHDYKVMKMLSPARPQSDATCRRLETVFRNVSRASFKETELQQLTEKFIALTERADATLQRLEERLGDDAEVLTQPSDVTSEADRLLKKLNGIKSEQEADDEYWGTDDDKEYDYDDEDNDDDQNVIVKSRHHDDIRSARRRHLHKHPYDRGPKRTKPPK